MGQIQEQYALVHVGVVGIAVTLNIALAPLLFLAPLEAGTQVEILVNIAIHFVNVDGVYALLEPVPLRLQPGNGFGVLPLFVACALSQSLHDPVEHLSIDTKAG